jgi:hypothetical protein
MERRTVRRQCKVAWLVLIVAILLSAGLGPACGGGAPSYRLTVAFNTSVTQADMDEVDQLIRRFDSSAEMLVTESFPPTGHVVVKTGTPDFCQNVESALDALPSVANVTCERLNDGSAGGG